MQKLLLILFFNANVLAAPMLSINQNFIHNDGSSFMGSLKGDEHFNWIEDNYGNIIKYNYNNKNYEYAIIQANKLMPSGVKVMKNINFTSSLNINKVSKNSIIPTIDKNNLTKIWRNKRAIFFNQ